jgi:hypothetical protein
VTKKSTSRTPAGRMDHLLGSAYEVLPFGKLEQPYQLAVGHYMAIDGEAWSAGLPADAFWLTREQQGRGLRQSLPKLVQLYGEVLFGVALLPSERVREAIMQDLERARDFPNWEAYHAWYSSSCVLPKHGTANRWPVVLSDFEDEILQDGWHRVHSYLKRGDDTIPAVFYPREHHLRQTKAIA